MDTQCLMQAWFRSSVLEGILFHYHPFDMGIHTKVVAMGGWKDLKTTQFYIRKAGVETWGISAKLSLHYPL